MLNLVDIRILFYNGLRFNTSVDAGICTNRAASTNSDPFLVGRNGDIITNGAVILDNNSS